MSADVPCRACRSRSAAESMLGARLPLPLRMGVRLTAAVLLNLVACGIAAAQPQVLWVQGPSWQSVNYDISYSRRHAPTVFEMGSAASTLGGAQAEVQSLQRWDASMTPSSSWRLAVIQVEVKPGQPIPSNGGGGSVPSPGRPLSDYRRAVQDAYRRAVDARDSLRRQVNSATDSGFRAANDLIRSYNTELNNAVAAYGKSNFSSYSSMPAVTWFYEWQYRTRSGSQSYVRGPFSSTSSMQADWNYVQRAYGSNARLLRYYVR